jgi:hypothetical protein
MSEDLALKVAALKVVSDYTTQRYNEARKEIGATMHRGDRQMARSPLGEVKLGAVTKTDPKCTALIADESAFTAWVEQHYPERMVYDFDVIGSEQEVKALLFEHAPHLLRKVAKPDPELVKQIRQDSVSIGVPMGPGGEVDVDGVEVKTPEPVVTCKPDPNALAAVVDLFRAGRLSFESLVRPELLGGEA